MIKWRLFESPFFLQVIFHSMKIINFAFRNMIIYGKET